MSAFSVVVYDRQATPAQQPTDGADIGPLLEDLVIETEIHGCSRATATMQAGYGDPWREQPRWLRKHYDVYMSYPGESFITFSGEIGEFGIDYNDQGGAVWHITFYGCASKVGRKHYAAEDVQNTQTSAIISDVFTDVGTTENDVTASAFTLQNGTPIELTGTAGDILNWAADFGKANVPYLWTLYPGETFGSLIGTARPRPTTPDLRAHIADFTSWGFRSLGGDVNRARVWYNDGVDHVDADNATHQADEPTGIGEVLPAEFFYPEIPSLTDATELADTIVAWLSQTRMVPSQPFTLMGPTPQIFDVSDGLETALPLHRVRAGMMLHLTDVRAGDGVTDGLAWNNLFLIAGTRYIEDEQSVEIIPEGYDDMLELAAARSEALLAGRHRL